MNVFSLGEKVKVNGSAVGEITGIRLINKKFYYYVSVAGIDDLYFEDSLERLKDESALSKAAREADLEELKQIIEQLKQNATVCVDKKSADEMFEEIGYEKDNRFKHIINYKDTENYFAIEIDNELKCAYIKDATNTQCVTFDEIKAIARYIEENE